MLEKILRCTKKICAARKKSLQKYFCRGIIFFVDGDVAQLGEHQVRNLGVEGSIPFVSTILTHKFHTFVMEF